jgi:hypothetical protein
VSADDERGKALKEHFDYLLQLGEVRATRVIATMVDGEQGHTNRGESVVDSNTFVYLPLSFGFRPCYKRYMAGMGYKVSCRPNGGIIVEGIDGKPINREEFVSFATYCRKWKLDYPHLKVSRPVEDICQYCFVFANRHRYLANHSGMQLCIECDDDGDDIEVVCRTDDGDEDDEHQQSQDGIESTSDSCRRPESATTTVAEEREVLLLESAMHIRMARSQRALYQLKMEEAQEDAREDKEHSERRYTFVVDYGQNMELPVYNQQQPGCTYYFSPLGVYNLGIGNGKSRSYV